MIKGRRDVRNFFMRPRVINGAGENKKALVAADVRRL
jgi:hypothetical protein